MIRRILWSGGFDSTFLVVDALLRGDTVEPFYVQVAKQPLGHKQNHECEALERIVCLLPSQCREHLRKLPRAPFIKYGDVWAEYRKLDSEIRQLTKDDYSPQLPMLAAVAHELHGVEAAFIADDFSIRNERSRLFMAAHDILTPLAGQSKSQLLRSAERQGFRHLLDLTWSCEGRGEGPCGECEPCKARIIPQQVFP